ncbi:MAG: neutral/alkaline non-lysosomal ceramidase N-terminal domain-containing protein [Oscillospiraceae bacterium]|nr:neutral/alkaline non-lysosomal ceramidase N-terminal domain-containing protein [Oscillospiraceae bacterium]
MIKMKRWLSVILAGILCLLYGCGETSKPENSAAQYSMGFGCADIAVPQNSGFPLYIAGYHMGEEIAGVLDEQQVRAVWIDDGEASVVIIAVDCIGLSSSTVAQIREKLKEFCVATDCGSINVVSTHTHAGIDTLGLWGPVGIDGKNPDFMDALIDSAAKAAQDAYSDRCAGRLFYGKTETEGLQSDSRGPSVYDSNLYQLRFEPFDGKHNAIRVFSFAAHAESLRGANRMVSRDYPGAVCDIIAAETGDDAVYLPGAIGGLIMTPVLCKGYFDSEENLRVTARKIADAVLKTDGMRALEPKLSCARVEFETELDNTLFIYYKFLGILQNNTRRGISGEYMIESELNVLRFGELSLALIPGEIFPELVSGTGKTEDPEALCSIARRHGAEELIVVGLANDELGYIVAPSDYLLDDELPYFNEAAGDHYEETNSVGKGCAVKIAEVFEKALAMTE